MHLAAHPSLDEMVLVVDTNGAEYALVWDGTSWGNPRPLDSGTGDTDVYVAYEQVSGRAMAVFGKPADGNGYYRIWDGSDWSAELPIPPPGGETKATRWFSMGSDPTSNRIALGVVTYDGGTSNSDIWLNM